MDTDNTAVNGERTETATRRFFPEFRESSKTSRLPGRIPDRKSCRPVDDLDE
jgi:hypothetical protein